MSKKKAVVRTKSPRGTVARTFTGTTVKIISSATNEVIDTVHVAKAKDKVDPMKELIKYMKETGNQGVRVELEEVNKSIALPIETFMNLGKEYDPTTGKYIEAEAEGEAEEAEEQE